MPLPLDDKSGKPKKNRQRISEQREELKSKRQKISVLHKELCATHNPTEVFQRLEVLKNEKLELLELKKGLRATKEQRDRGEPPTGTLPDFVIIGAQKCGTTSLYRLLIQHPYVKPAIFKELRFFDQRFDLGVEWYRQCFPTFHRKHGKFTITGEATPDYIFYSYIPERMKEVIPKVRIITLLRNPVDRAYSHFHHEVRKGREFLPFEGAIEAEETRLPGEESVMSVNDGYEAKFNLQHFSYLSRGLYAEQLSRWSAFFPAEQILVLKSEDFFERPHETLERILRFLDIPAWEPDPQKLAGQLNPGHYEGRMDPTTRRKLEGYFEAHNRKLYEYLGEDFSW